MFELIIGSQPINLEGSDRQWSGSALFRNRIKSRETSVVFRGEAARVDICPEPLRLKGGKIFKRYEF